MHHTGVSVHQVRRLSDINNLSIHISTQLITKFVCTCYAHFKDYLLVFSDFIVVDCSALFKTAVSR